MAGGLGALRRCALSGSARRTRMSLTGKPWPTDCVCSMRRPAARFARRVAERGDSPSPEAAAAASATAALPVDVRYYCVPVLRRRRRRRARGGVRGKTGGREIDRLSAEKRGGGGGFGKTYLAGARALARASPGRRRRAWARRRDAAAALVGWLSPRHRRGARLVRLRDTRVKRRNNNINTKNTTAVYPGGTSIAVPQQMPTSFSRHRCRSALIMTKKNQIKCIFYTAPPPTCDEGRNGVILLAPHQKHNNNII